MFDPEAFGAAMADLIEEAVAPLQKRISELEAQIAKPVDVSAQVERAVALAVASLPPPRDGRDGLDATPVVVDDVVAEVLRQMPVPANGTDGRDGIDGADGVNGADGLGLAGAMIDRTGALLITLTNGDVKNLGPVVGKDGVDGKDGLSLDGFELEYVPETHEIALKATAAGRVKELRYPAGGIRPAGYWREGTKAKAGEAWVHDGSTFYAKTDTAAKPESKSDDWIIGARRGRDGETTFKTVNAGPAPAIKLGS
ncbi:hypothetical protein [Variovorax paradoxus]|uniref:Uncharacterized protein n=1 Tax=Variovorax paradoxus TaxID=34073 RepID=A0A679J964_VARPD|nr:hypothetical protein VVAX_04338 [Variovorax paradoxus]